MENKLPQRKHTRLQEYDYSTPGAYFVTICTHNRKNLLSRIVGAIHESPETQLTAYGKIVDVVIRNIPTHLHITVDRYVIMPNHIHLILLITEGDLARAIHESPLQNRSLVSNAVGYIKMNASKAIHQHHSHLKIWQRGYYDHVIRNQADYDEIAKYVLENPLRWELDKLYTEELCEVIL